MNSVNSNSTGIFPYLFCALRYQPRGQNDASPSGRVIVLALRDGEQGLHFLVDPDWRALVEPADQEYIEAILKDFLERRKSDPESLFRQIASLAVGPLITADVGTNCMDLYPYFVPLENCNC